MADRSISHQFAAVKPRPILWPWQAERGQDGRPFWASAYHALSWSLATLSANAWRPAYWGDPAAAATLLHVAWLRLHGGVEASARASDRPDGGRPWGGVGELLVLVPVNAERRGVA